ncbi:lipopolysaccharide biosynthesis protein, partial [Streptomyces hainanensis]
MTLGTLLGALLGAGYGLLNDREYASSGYVVVRAVGDTDPAVALGFAQSFGRMATGDAVLDAARREAGLSVADLRGRVRAATSPDAPVIEITGRAARAGDAARAANAVSRALIDVAAEAAAETSAELTELTELTPALSLI